VSLTALVGRLLPELDAAFPTDLTEVLQRFLAEHAGADGEDAVDLLLADYELEQLVRVRRDEPAASVQGIPVSRTDAGRAFSTQAVVVVAEDQLTTVHVPVSLRAERLGVLRVRLAGSVSADVLDGLQQVATVVAHVVFGAARFTDMYEQARRRKPLSLDAEMQWNLLPVRAFAGPCFEVAGQLMPAYDVGGDSFDYSVESGALHLSCTDAMGHGVQASLLDTLAVSALRNSRRAGASLTEQARQAQAALVQQFGEVTFVTALVARIDLATGDAQAVNAGHPPAHLLRDGRLQTLELTPQLPLALAAGTRYRAQHFSLRPRDRLVIASDGVTEASARGGEPFGEGRLQGTILATATEPPYEAVRRVLQTASAYQQGVFRDDATVLCLDWHGTPDPPAAMPRR
jgi:serine phosphatase RsbU (regulator of sigma subunit)